jgi:enoyl-[acyl-carrier protein] reductase I
MTPNTITSLMKGKRGVIMGLANDRSIAWGISKVLQEHGAELIFTYPSDALLKRVQPLANSLGFNNIYKCDVTNQQEIVDLYTKIGEDFGKIDFVVHSIAFSNKNELEGKYVDTSLDNFLTTMNISCYSFVAVVREAAKIMNDNGAFLTLSYYGAEKVIPHYNVMGIAKAALETSVKYLAVDLGGRGIRVNGISAGPVKTLAASGIGDFKYIFRWNEYNAPLKKNITIEEVGNGAMFLLSSLSTGTTGEIMHIDAGYNVVGMKAIDAPDIALVKE